MIIIINNLNLSIIIYSSLLPCKFFWGSFRPIKHL